MELDVNQTNPCHSLQEYLGEHECLESEAQKLAKREEYLSTDIVKVDLLRSLLYITIPDNVLEEIERNNRRIEFIQEIREKAKKNPMYDNRFPEGNTPVRDVQKLLDDLDYIKNCFINEGILRTTTEAIDNHLQVVFDRFLNDCESYTKYI